MKDRHRLLHGLLGLSLLLLLSAQTSLPRTEVWIAGGISQQEIAPRTFWMMNTLIPLDMLFLDANRRVINIQENALPCAAPRRCPTYNSTAPAKYVLEIPGGRARALGLQAGDQVHF